jgi:hypothetical protein
MFCDLDTFFTSLYYHVDLLFQRFLAPLRPPSSSSFSDSEIITLFLAFQWNPYNSERSMHKYASTHWLHLFPKLIERSYFNRRVRQLSTFICALTPLIAKNTMDSLGASPFFEIIDGIICPVVKCCRTDHSSLMDLGIDYGRGGSDKRFHCGFKLLSVINSHGLITGFLISPANTEERFLAESLFRFRQNPSDEAPSGSEMDFVLGATGKPGTKSIRAGITGPVVMAGVGFKPNCPYVGDSGFHGKKWHKMWKETYQINMVTKECFVEESKFARETSNSLLGSLRQNIETMQSHLVEEFKLWYPKARSFAGLIARIGAKYAIQNICMAINMETKNKIFEIRKYNPILM